MIHVNVVETFVVSELQEKAEAPRRIQSPSYPILSLQDAIAMVAKLEARYRTSTIDRLDAVKLLGFNGNTGPANMTLGALSHFGLTERAGKGELRVTALARSILHPLDLKERIEAVRQAATTPQLYRSLQERFADVSVPPEEGVVTYLNRANFNPTAIRPAARAFLHTMAFVRGVAESESSGVTTQAAQDEPGAEDTRPPSQQTVEAQIPMNHQHAPVERATNPSMLDERASSGTDLRFRLARGVVVQIRSPDELGEAELTKLVGLLTAQRDALKED